MSDSFHCSQESDILPPDFKHLINSESYEDIISAVENEPFMKLMSSPTCAMLTTDEYAGPFGFEIQIDGGSSGKQWMFSYDLNKLFINIDTAIHLGFKCEPFQSGLFVRAVPVYCETDAFQEPIVRCLFHRAESNPHNKGFSADIFDHVLRIIHSDAMYDYDESSERRSVRVPLGHPQAGTDWVTVEFKFMCKNSCISGMNRRPTDVIFTLEDSNLAVLGRRKMKVRICSCPKRDKTKEEEDMKSKHGNTVPQGKRAVAHKTEDDPSSKLRKVDLFQISLLDKEALVDVTDYARSRILRKLRIEKRGATEKEEKLLNDYECTLQMYE
ncbi:cellular tumor antigen p53 isoform X2 [Zootermopsis nevadensis]|uniref:cellular tumor antigen p53 isoform X2 n=1 Tax=Zootermopsis nevadensis TaxID=136037 RepID=UPI000B8EC651|nr:cellular tumor antigen p53 isoform X2 [Zootermopsis nevadensis]